MLVSINEIPYFVPIKHITAMTYYFSKILHNTSYEKAIEKATEELKKEGFGVLTQIDVRDTLKQKIDADFRKYIILGACNPHFAHEALQLEGKLGAFLPCNVVVEELDSGEVEVSAVDPHAMMASVDNPALETLAAEVRERLLRVVAGIGE